MENQKLQLVTFEQAKRLEKTGFDWFVRDFYIESGLFISGNVNRFDDILRISRFTNDKKFYAPTVALALKWFRDTKGMYSDGGFYVLDKQYRFFFGEQKRTQNEKRTDVFDTYEAAESALLDELLTLIEK